MLMFDIGANRGDAVVAGLNKGYKVIALEPAPRVFAQLVSNFIYNPNVVPLKYAASNKDYQVIDFYEAEENGLSTANLDWLTGENMPYAGKPFRSITATTITVETLADIYGQPDLIKIDVEGNEWAVLRGIKNPYPLAFEWTEATLPQHMKQLIYLSTIGYTEWAPQFIEHHLQEPDDWFSLHKPELDKWISRNRGHWEQIGWQRSNLRPTADVGMCWVR